MIALYLLGLQTMMNAIMPFLMYYLTLNIAFIPYII